ncbi:MAG: hypothetical protein A3B25_03755 [Candidatus Ryanbacteria bacterium RIFCSPLOWO2_01_FULL_48_26]|uniref:DUF8128 domain-containing protein n=1 Tax=Candidatus Ryanbacteria bacterium RIFCSPLOWO2_01_FULL_48_26 TaxID=1802126 RepID=A0A1G2GSY9_9BACT|nr:MAG: hypothetical protein A3B25_03755 [Candidatus Ryanbacteria bacterium RIFCSPLOWO2_01_FULL_48_26]
MALFYFLTILAFSAAVGILFYFAGRKAIRRRKMDLANSVLLAIQIPYVRGEAADFKTEFEKFEAFLRRLASFNCQSSLEVCVAHIGDFVQFHISVPRAFVGSVKEEIYSLLRGARVGIVHSDPGIFGSHGVSLGGYVLQKKDHIFSIRTHKTLKADPFASMLEVFSRVRKVGEGVGMQIILCPVSLRHKKSIARSLASIARGELGDIVARTKLVSKGGIDIPSASAEIEERKNRKRIMRDIFGFARNKLSQPIFEANVRVCVSAGTKFRAKEVLDEIAASFRHFDDPYHNEFKFAKPLNSEKLIGQFIARRFSNAETVVLSSEEIASFYHFPTSAEKLLSGARRFQTKQIPIPSNLSSGGICIGENEFHGEAHSVFLGNERGDRHVYIVGEENTGKSTLVGNMLIQDVERGHGVALIDPSGKLAQAILGRIPSKRVAQVLYLTMADAMRVPVIDLFRLDHGITAEKKKHMAHELGSVVNKFFELDTRGVMFDEYVQNAILLLLESTSENASIFDLPRVFTDKKYREKLLSKSRNGELAHFWEYKARSSSGAAVLEYMAPFVFSKFKKFASSNHLRSALQDPVSAVDIESAVLNGKIILIDLGEDRLGKENSKFLGMLIANKILAAAQAGEENRNERKQFSVYFDDCESYAPDSVAKIVSGSRRHHINLTLSTRSIGSLSAKIREAIFKNIVSTIVFRVNPRDAGILAAEFEPSYTKHDLLSVDDFNAYARVAVHGELSEPFSIKIKTESWEVGSVKIARRIREYSRLSHYRDVRE